MFDSVLNTDSFDKRRFKEIYQMSEKMRELKETGSEKLPSFYSLMGDIWASLYKMKPEMKEEISKGLEMNRSFMEQIMSDQSFQSFRDFTRLDDLSSALGTVKFSEKTFEWLEQQELNNQEFKNVMKKMQKQHRQLQQIQEQLQDSEQNDLSKKNQSQQQKAEQEQIEKQLNRKKKRLEKSIEKSMSEFSQSLQQQISNNSSSFSHLMKEAANETKEAKNDLKSLVGGIKQGSGDAELKKVPLRDQITLAEKMSSNKKIKEIAEWAGRFKQIARKKQKSKHNESVERSGVFLGNKVDRLVPMELGFYMNPATKQDFLRRFSEGQTFIYDQKGKEQLGKGPIVLCLDQSGSMNKLDTQSKGFALALMSIARKQKRDFALIPFSTITETFKYKKGKITPHDMVEMASKFLGGGTYFDKPLLSALEVIEESRFKKADIIFVTDGEAYLSEKFINDFNQKKKEKEISVLSILLGNNGVGTVKQFSDKVVKASSLKDEKSLQAFEI